MPDHNARIVRGLSIATVVLAALAILASLAAAAFLAVGGTVLSDPSFIEELLDEGDSYYYYSDSYHHSDSSLSTSEASSLMSMFVGLAAVSLVWCLLCSCIVLVAGILGIRNSSKPDKLNAAFGWAIAGAVASLLGGSWITLVLLIISAVYLNRMRKAATMPYGQAGMPYAPSATYPPYSQPNGYGQPAGYGQLPYGQQLSCEQQEQATQTEQSSQAAQPAQPAQPAQSAAQPSQPEQPSEEQPNQNPQASSDSQ